MQNGKAVKALIMLAWTRLGTRSLLLEAFAISTLSPNATKTYENRHIPSARFVQHVPVRSRDDRTPVYDCPKV